MKYLIIILIIFNCFQMHVHCGWLEKELKDTKYSKQIRCIDNLDSLTIIAPERTYQNVYKSTDGGESWYICSRDSTYCIDEETNEYYIAKTFLNIDIVNENLAFISCLDGRVLKSTDLFETFERIQFDTEADMDYLHFYNDSIGVIGGYPVAYITQDAGNSWDTLHFPPEFNIFNKIYMTAPDKIFVDGYNYDDQSRYYSIYNLQECTWEINQRIDSFKVSILDIHFFDERNGLWAGYRKYSSGLWQDEALIYRTSDGGLNWASVLDSSLQYIGGGLEYIKFLNDKFGIASGYYYYVLFSTDAGNSWDTIPYPDIDDGYLTNTAILSRDRFIFSSSSLKGRLFIYNRGSNSVKEADIPDITNINIFPNPVNKGEPITFNIQPEKPCSLKITLYDALGRKAADTFLKSFFTGGTIKYNPDSVLLSGLYIVEIKIDDKVFTRHLIVE